MCLVIGRELKDYILNDSAARLIQSFLDPSWLIVEKEISPQRKDAQVIIVKVIYVHLDFRKRFIALVWNDQPSLFLHHFHKIIFPFFVVPVKFQIPY